MHSGVCLGERSGGKCGPGRGNRMYKGPEARESILCLRECKLLDLAIAESVAGG